MSVVQTDILLTIRTVLRTDLGVAIEDNDVDFFAQLNVDSLAFLNAIARLEKFYEIKFANEEIPSLCSCSKLADGILAHLSEGERGI